MRAVLVLAVLLLSGCAPPAMTVTVSATAPPVPSASATSTAKQPSPAPVFAWVLRFGSASAAYSVVTDTGTKLGRLDAAGGAVASPDGQRFAYWWRSPTAVSLADELRVWEMSDGRERVLLKLRDEAGSSIAWANDGTAVVAGIRGSGGVGGGVDPPPSYSAVRTVTLSDGSVREIVRKPAMFLSPISWDRGSRRIVVYTGWAERWGNLLVLGEDGTLATAPTDQRLLVRSEHFGADAARAIAFAWFLSFEGAGVGAPMKNISGVLRWALVGDPKVVERRTPTTEAVLAAALVPGADDLLVLITEDTNVRSRLEVWSAAGDVRTLATFPERLGLGQHLLQLRADGRAIYVVPDDPKVPVREVTLATGAVKLLPAFPDVHRMEASLIVGPR